MLSLVLLGWLYTKGYENRGHADVLSDGRVEFPPNRLAFATWIIASAIPAWGVIEALVHRSGKPLDLWISIVIIGLALMELGTLPGTIVVTRERIEQIYWLRKARRIRWSDVTEINTGNKIQIVTITGSDGTEIVHSERLPDRPRLLEEIRRYCGSELPPDFPRETTTPA